MRALKRIETEGAGQLAEALDTPQQAFKDLQNAAEDLMLRLGDLLQPALIAFIKELDWQRLEAYCIKWRKSSKIAELISVLQNSG